MDAKTRWRCAPPDVSAPGTLLWRIQRITARVPHEVCELAGEPALCELGQEVIFLSD